MKKLLCTLLVCAFAFAGCLLGVSGISARAEGETAECAVSDFTELPEEQGEFDGLPSDWQLYEECAVDRTNVSCENGNLTVSHDADHGVSAAQYYGAVYLLGTDKIYSDFALEMTVKAKSYFDAARWFGVMYHTRMVGTNLVGYMMNYRYAGASASSAVDASRGFNDDPKQEGLTSLTDKAWHTVKIEMTGTTARHYMDNKLIKEWDVTSKDSLFGETLESGGFALIVNRSALQIKSYKIEGKTATVAKPDETVVATYIDPNIKMTNAPTVVCDVTDKTTYDSLFAGERRPSNAILRLDGNCDVVTKHGEKIDSFDTVYRAFDAKVIPVLYVQDETAADALIKYFKEERNLLDVAVMSDNPSLVKKVRSANNRVRGIVEYGEENFAQKNNAELYTAVKTTNENFANVAVIPQNVASAENVRYIQSRFKTVWVRASDTAAMNVYDCVGSGAYGIVASDFNAVYDVLESYPEETICRMPFNVAHRGLPKTHNENSVSGVKAAIAAGATHLEIDGHICKADAQGKREIVIMHDATLERTTNGTGAIANMTMEEIREYKLDMFGEEQIPTFDDIFSAMEDSSVVLVFEIKTNDLAIVPLLKEKLTEYNAWDRVVVISFYTSILGEMKKILPEVPTANLNEASSNTMVSTLNWMGLYNTGVDTTYPFTSEAFNAALRDRGVIGWYWTYDSGEAMNIGAKAGYVGLTTNQADAYGKVGMLITGKTTTEESMRVGAQIRLMVTSYAGEQRETRGTVLAVEEKDTYWQVVASYRWIKDLCTQSFRIEKAQTEVPPVTDPEEPGENQPPQGGEEQPPQEQPPVSTEKGCKSAVTSSGTVISVMLLAVAVCLLPIKRKKTHI